MCNIRIKHKYKIPFNRIDFATVLFFIKMVVTIEAMSSCLVNTVQLTTNADRQLLIAFVSKRFYYDEIR